MEDEALLQSKLKKFMEWCDKNDIQSPKAILRYCGPDEGFGFFATENFRSNEAVVEVPKNMMITSTLIIGIPEYYELLSSNKTVKLEPFEIIVLFFYCEHLKGIKSTWKPYISMLPGSFSTPLAMGLDPTLLPSVPRQLYEKQIIEVKQMSTKFKNFIPDLDYSLFLWAWHCCNTRCIYFDNNSNKHELIDSSSSSGDSIAVIPLMDMLNHDPIANCLPGFDKYSQKYRVTVGERMVMENEQLYVCYGPHDNGKLWVEYGFRLSKNLFNNVTVNLDLILAICPKINFTPKDANIQAAKEAAFSCNLYGSEETISYGLRKTCILLLLSPKELAQWKRIIYDEDYLDENNTLLQKANELALKIIKEISQRLQSKLEKTVDKNVALLYSDQIDLLNSVISNSQ